MSFTDEEIEEFKNEACELLDIAEKSLLALDKGADFKICYNAIFRSFHNLKGGAGMMELGELCRHTHELETIFTQFQDKTNIPFEYLSFFLNGVDAARLILGGEKVSFSYDVKKVAPQIKVEEKEEMQSVLGSISVDEFLMSCSDYIENIARCLQELEKEKIDKEVLHDLYRYVHSLKGDAFLFSFNRVGEVAHAMETALEPVRDGVRSAQKPLISCLYKSLDIIELLLAHGVAGENNKGLSKMVDTICHALVKASHPLETAPSNIVPLKVEGDGKNAKDSEVSSSSIRVSVNLLDSLMTLMGEMVLVRNQVLQYSNTTEDLEFLKMSKRLNVVTNEIQEQMMKTRMQDIGTVLNRFNRVVRDLASELGKKIAINIQGAETGLDKSLLEAIKDPLTHIVRNSCDHGIESSEERLRKGKSEIGKIEIKAYHEGGQVFIEVSDDGKGLSRDHILKKAIEKSLISTQQANQLSDKEVFDLIFLPGFSTAAQVTNVSGRGVGMDVVRTNIERIGGNIELFGEENVGTTIKIKIPLTLAIIPALMVKCNGATFAIPQLKLEELVRVDLEENPHQIEMLHGAAMYRLRDNILQLVDMNGILDEKSSNLKSRKIINIAVLSSDHAVFGLIIDEVLDTADIVVKPLNRILKSLQIYSGATIMGDGSVALIFDVMGIAKIAQINSGHKNIVKEEKVISESQDFLLLKVNSHCTHGISLNYVERLEEFKKSSIEFTGQQMVIRYRDNILPLIRISEQLGYDNKELDELFHVVVIERAGLSYGLIVNSIVDTLSTTNEVKAPIRFHQGIVGNINMPTELIVVIDPFQIVDKALGIIHEPVTHKMKSVQQDNNKILLVEDTVFFRRLMQGVLENEGFEILIAQDGKEAIDVLNKHGNEITLIVSDIEMPRMNGFEMARAIRQYPHYKNLPMIAVSSKADSNYRNEGMRAGFDMYLEKLRPEILLSAIDELKRTKRGAA